LVAIVSTLLMIFVQKLPEDHHDTNVTTVETESDNDNSNNNNQLPSLSTTSIWYKATAAWRLLLQDRKMKYMIGLNAIFGFTSSFLTSYVNGTVVRYVLGSDTYVGVLTAWVSCVAAICSVLFGYITTNTVRKGYVLIFGAICFMCVGGLFIIYPNVSESHQWNWLSLAGIYTLHGIGRSTFEGTLKSTFADYFAYEKEGAFANIILQNGLSSAFGFMLTFTLHCSKRQQESWGPYCIVNNKDGSVHDVLTFELLIVVTAILAIFGYRRAAAIRHEEMSRVLYENIPTTII
jgi:MFS family permease